MVGVAQTGDTAEASVWSWGFDDDSVGGSQMRLEIQRRDGAWHVSRIFERELCPRGESDELCI